MTVASTGIWALLEAIAFSFKRHIEVFHELGLPEKRVFITNGGSKSTLWRSIIADVAGYDLTYVTGVHQSAPPSSPAWARALWMKRLFKERQAGE